MIGSGFLVDFNVAGSFFAGALFAWYLSVLHELTQANTLVGGCWGHILYQVAQRLVSTWIP